MVQYDAYVAGWLDSSIHEFLATFPLSSASAAYALITCLDSNVEPSNLLKKNREFRSALPDARPLRKGLLVPSKVLQEASVRDQLFVGFDEVWFFPSDEIAAKPEASWIVGPDRVDQAKLDKLGRWMAENGCSLALGDGDGLNMIVKAHGHIKSLIAQSLSQPARSLRNDLWVQNEEEGKKTTNGKAALSTGRKSS
jgi:hypothetical protein